MLKSEKFQQISDNYLANLPSYLEQIKTFHHAQDWESLKAVAHSVKGSAGCFNFDAIYKSAGNLEENLKSNDKLQRDEIINSVIVAIQQAIESK